MKRISLLLTVLFISFSTGCDWKSAVSWPSGEQVRELYPAFDFGSGSATVLEYNSDEDDLIWYVQIEDSEHTVEDLVRRCKEHEWVVENSDATGLVAAGGAWRFEVKVLSPNRFIVYRTDHDSKRYLLDDFNRHIIRLGN